MRHRALIVRVDSFHLGGRLGQKINRVVSCEALSYAGSNIRNLAVNVPTDSRR